MPYFPPGESSLPSSRFVIFADTNNLVRQWDERLATRNGAAFTGRWMSSTLNRRVPAREYTLRRLILSYTSIDAVIMQIAVSGNGGETWNETRTLSLRAALSGTKRVAVGFNTTGYDLRFELRFTSQVVCLFTGYSASLVERSDAFL